MNTPAELYVLVAGHWPDLLLSFLLAGGLAFGLGVLTRLDKVWIHGLVALGGMLHIAVLHYLLTVTWANGVRGALVCSGLSWALLTVFPAASFGFSRKACGRGKSMSPQLRWMFAMRILLPAISLLSALFQPLLAAYGPVTLAGYSATGAIPPICITFLLMSCVLFAYGYARFEAKHHPVGRMLALPLSAGTQLFLLAAVYLLLGDPLLRLFTENPAVLAVSVSFARAFGVGLLLGLTLCMVLGLLLRPQKLWIYLIVLAALLGMQLLLFVLMRAQLFSDPVVWFFMQGMMYAAACSLPAAAFVRPRRDIR